MANIFCLPFYRRRRLPAAVPRSTGRRDGGQTLPTFHSAGGARQARMPPRLEQAHFASQRASLLPTFLPSWNAPYRDGALRGDAGAADVGTITFSLIFSTIRQPVTAAPRMWAVQADLVGWGVGLTKRRGHGVPAPAMVYSDE